MEFLFLGHLMNLMNCMQFCSFMQSFSAVFVVAILTALKVVWTLFDVIGCYFK